MPRRIFGCILLSLFYSLQASSQQPADLKSSLRDHPIDLFADSLKQALAKAQSDEDKVRFLQELALESMEAAKAESFGNQSIEVAELSRNRRLMAGAYLQNGKRYLNTPGLANNLDHALSNLRRAEEIARVDELPVLQVASYASMATVWRYKGDLQKALSYSMQAMSIASNSENDSALIKAYCALGDTYMAMSENLLSLQNFIKALSIAEKYEDGRLREVYMSLLQFYAGIRDYSKAADYAMKAYQLDRNLWAVHDMIADKYTLADLFARENKLDLALRTYESSILLADSVHYDMMKLNSYFRIFLMYFTSRQYVKGLAYLKDHPIVTDYLKNAGFQFFIYLAQGMGYSEQNKFDSAGLYFRKTEPDLEKKGNPEVRFLYYTCVGEYHARKKDYRQAILSYTRAYSLGDSVKGLEWQEASARQLDSIYSLAGDYKKAFLYNTFYHSFKDSLASLSNAMELKQLEVENDLRRRERLAREEELRIEHRHNLQYLGFTIGLVLLFITLAALGWFAVPPGLIRGLGFLSFIFLFEFIILLADKSIQHLTHEEPWKVLLIKIALAAILVPLHHWLEHKVIHYLSHRKRIRRPAPASMAAPVGESA